MPAMKKRTLNDEEQYNEDIRFNIAVRETFLNRFVHMFLMYENFVIMPDQVLKNIVFFFNDYFDFI